MTTPAAFTAYVITTYSTYALKPYTVHCLGPSLKKFLRVLKTANSIRSTNVTYCSENCFSITLFFYFCMCEKTRLGAIQFRKIPSSFMELREGTTPSHTNLQQQWCQKFSFGVGIKPMGSCGGSPPEAEAVCRHCLQILTTQTIKFCTIHFMILDKYVSRWGEATFWGLSSLQPMPAGTTNPSMANGHQPMIFEPP